jgi:hypothetical protein
MAQINDLQVNDEEVTKAVKDKHSTTIDNILQVTNLTITMEVMELVLPPKFKVP